MMVLFILVYFVAAALAKPPELSNMTATKIETTTNDTIGYLQFDDISFNLTDFTICTWFKFSYYSHAQTIFRLTTENRKESVMLWRMHARPTTEMRMTINNRLVASEKINFAKRQWTHVCFQWKGLTGVWAMFVNAKIHSVGQTTVAKNDTMASAAAWKLRGKGVGIIGDDSAPCRNVWQVYGLYLTGSAATATRTASTSGKPSSNVTATVGKPPPWSNGAGGKVKNSIKRQAVYDSDSDEPSTGDTGSSKPFQWFTKTLAFVKRVFTFIIIPFFKFVRDTFFQTRSLDDTVVDVSETHLTISDVKVDVELQPVATTTVATTTVAAAAETATSTTATTTIAATAELPVDEFPLGADNDKKNKRHVSSSPSSKTTMTVDDRCGTDNGLVTTADLLAAGGSTVATHNTLSPNARRYLRIVSDGLNDVGVNVAFVKRAFACCRSRLIEPRTDVVVVIDWDRTPAKAYNLTTSPHVCGRSY